MTLNINYKTFAFTLEPKDIIVLPPYKGSTFRGGFGSAFKRIVCALKNADCSGCLLKQKCVYSYVFETPPAPDSKVMRKYRAAPHPFIIEPPPERKRIYKPGDKMKFNLILIGRAVDYLPYFIYTFSELGKIGIGKGRAGFELKEVVCDEKAVYDSDSKTLKPFEAAALPLDFDILHGGSQQKLQLSFQTPARIVYDSRLAIDIEFHMLIRQLLRRLSLLSYFHCGIDPSGWDFKGMIDKAKDVKVGERNLKWHDWERYSARQDARMKLGGFTGEITFEGDIEPFMTLIRAGEVLHVGKGTSFGLGKYIIQDSKFKVQD